jgi:hypothetical protein
MANQREKTGIIAPSSISDRSEIDANGSLPLLRDPFHIQAYERPDEQLSEKSNRVN